MGSESSNFHEKMMVGGAGRSNRFQTSSPVKKKSSAAQILPHVHLSELLIKRCPTTIHRSLPISTPERLRLLRSTLPYLPLTALQESKAVLLHNPTYSDFSGCSRFPRALRTKTGWQWQKHFPMGNDLKEPKLSERPDE